jgi:hypothetical protein
VLFLDSKKGNKNVFFASRDYAFVIKEPRWAFLGSFIKELGS